jgi:hypothetical protein
MDDVDFEKKAANGKKKRKNISLVFSKETPP